MNTKTGSVWVGVALGMMYFMTGAVAQNVTIKGSDTMLVMNQQLAQQYMKEFPGTNIQVSGGGSGVGIAALRDNTTDIAAASRLIKPKEMQDFLVNLGIQPTHFSVALDGIAMFVNTSNPVKELTVEQLGKIFHGEYTNWSQVGGPDMPIDVYSRENTSGTYSFVKDEVLKDADYTTRAQTLPGTAAVYDAVSKDPKGIGYGGIGYNQGVKLLQLKVDATSSAYLPTEENVEKKVYPLSRSLNYYLNPRSSNPQAAKFIQWVLSEEGQKIVVKANYFALPGVLKSAPTAVATESPIPASLSITNTPVPAIPAPSPALSPSTPQPTLAEREARVLEREEAVVKREESLAARETALAQRETQLNTHSTGSTEATSK